jgi:hypothetical protein
MSLKKGGISASLHSTILAWTSLVHLKFRMCETSQRRATEYGVCLPRHTGRVSRPGPVLVNFRFPSSLSSFHVRLCQACHYLVRQRDQFRQCREGDARIRRTVHQGPQVSVAASNIQHDQPPKAPHFGGAHESLVRSAKLISY